MDPIVLAAGTALVTAMATDTWQQARSGAVALWRRVRPEQEKAVEDELAEVRLQILAARDDGDTDTERALAGAWQIRLQQLLREDPDLANELKQVLDNVLTPALSLNEREQYGEITMKATASGQGRVYQAGRDQHITER
ncbi:hypothetical protein [Streptosporangium carneum]|uniref:Uncharacterized protein n=1 Tax=Streptosporangium carneum TaxID=47481 RepID=A0A9W6HXH8_9ACTN|nr:hypothetical protein [Streptosporangium carneum]GLK07566.1 hypothetical protein GCM10017600_09710 [Streptosporangium carneum]